MLFFFLVFEKSEEEMPISAEGGAEGIGGIRHGYMEEVTSEMFCKISGIFQVEKGSKISQTERLGVFGNVTYLFELGWEVRLET